MNPINRRQVLRGLFVGGGAVAFGGLHAVESLLQAQADTEPERTDIPERYYIFCYFNGGWDILLSLDPRDPSRFNDGNMSVTRIQPGYQLLQNVPTGRMDAPFWRPKNFEDLSFGPFIGRMSELAERLLIIRGMSMDTLTHQVGMRRFLTGRPPSGLSPRGSSTDTWLSNRLAGNEPLPNLSIRVESYNVDQPNSATAVRTSSSDDLLRLLSPGQTQFDELQERQLDELLRRHALCAETRHSPALRAAEQSRASAQTMLKQRLDEVFDFRASSTAAIQEHFNITAAGFNPSSSKVQAAIAATAITQGLSRCVSIEAARGLDTHFDNWGRDHGRNQMEGFDAIADLASYLAKTPFKNDPNASSSWLDHTTIIGFSEFSRTPLLNSSEGRDHWLNNACFMLGGGVKGGRVLGQSSDYGMNPQKLNLETGALDPDGEVVRPEHILQALYNEVGITEDEPDLRVEPFNAIFG